MADALWHVASLTARLKASLSCALRPALVTVVFNWYKISWLHLLLGQPLPLFPSTYALINISFSKQRCLFSCPQYFSFLDKIVFYSHSSGMLLNPVSTGYWVSLQSKEFSKSSCCVSIKKHSSFFLFLYIETMSLTHIFQ